MSFHTTTTSVALLSFCLLCSLCSGVTISINSTTYGEEILNTSYTYTNSSDLELSFDVDAGEQKVAIWFPSVQLPRAANIISAYIQFMSSDDTIPGVSDTPVTVQLSAERSFAPALIREGYFNVTNRIQTNNYVNWSIPVWNYENDTTVTQRSPNLAPVLNELITQNTWKAGNNIVFLIARAPNDTSNGTRMATSGGLGYGAPRLIINYNTTGVKWVNTTLESYSEEDMSNKVPYISTTMLQLTYSSPSDQVIALRFTDIFLPRNATLARAFIQFTCSNPSFRDIQLRIALEDNLVPDPFYTIAGDVTNRTRTNSILWTPPAWENLNDTTMAQQADIGQLLLPYLQDPTEWSLGSSLVVIITQDLNGTNKNHSRYAWAEAIRPVLRIAYTGGELSDNQVIIKSTEHAEEYVYSTNEVMTSYSRMYIPFDATEGKEAMIGLRFPNITVPQYATIVDARVQFRSAGSFAPTYVLTRVLGERTTGASAYNFSETRYNVSSRPTTFNFVDWDMGEWQDKGDAFEAERTPNIAPVLQEIVSLPSWKSGNAISLFFIRSPNDATYNYRMAVSGYDGIARPFLILQFNSTANLANKPDPSTLMVRCTSFAEQQELVGNVSIISSDTELPYDKDSSTLQRVGLRFPGIKVPLNTYVTSAFVQFESKDTDLGSLVIRISLEGSFRPSAFGPSTFNVSLRSEMSYLDWSVPAWATYGLAGPEQRTPDISDLINELTMQPGWTSGNDIVVMFRRAAVSSGTNTRVPHSGIYGGAAYLVVTYATPLMNTVSATMSSFAVEDVSSKQTLTSTVGDAIYIGSNPNSDTFASTYVGLRFSALPIPQGRPILFATIQFTVKEATSGAASMDVCVESLSSSRSAFTAVNGSVSSRPLISCTQWRPSSWLNIGDRSIGNQIWNAKPLITTLTSNTNWSSSSAVVFVIKRSSTDPFREYRAADTNSSLPSLYVVYQTSGSATPSRTPSVTPSVTPSISVSISISPSASVTRSPSYSSSRTSSISLGASASASESESTTATASLSFGASPSNTASMTTNPSFSSSATKTQSFSASRSVSASFVNTASPSKSWTSSSTHTSSRSASVSRSPAETPSVSPVQADSQSGGGSNSSIGIIAGVVSGVGALVAVSVFVMFRCRRPNNRLGPRQKVAVASAEAEHPKAVEMFTAPRFANRSQGYQADVI